MKVLVFKTSVPDKQSAQRVTPVLNSLAGKGCWNFALDDCDKILRIASPNVNPARAVFILKQFGFECKELDDSL
jgi:hypothetical protein